MSYLTLIVLTLIIGFGAQAWVNHALKKYARVPNSQRLTGASLAIGMLNYYGIAGVEVRMGGAGQDFFNPKDNSITLDPDVFNGTSITALATACHEVGHACQFAEDYSPMKIRTALVPAVNLASNAWIFLLIAGLALNAMGLVNLAIIMYAVAVAFSIITLPVEFNASNRALEYMKTINLPSGEVAGSANVLRACAFTYVAAMLTSVLQLLWLLQYRD
ncbi:MAG: zinc metallopeptidase [Anaerotardibacter sp.]